MAGYSNAARNLVAITAGVDYTLPAVWNSGTTYAAAAVVSYQGTNYASLAGSNTGHNPATSQGYWIPQPATAGYTPPIFCLLCTTTSTGTTEIRAIGDSTYTSFPAGSFVKGQQYDIYLAELVSAGGVTFVGYR